MVMVKESSANRTKIVVMILKYFVPMLMAGMCMMACSDSNDPLESRVDKILSEMTLEEKIGQMNQLNAEGTFVDIVDRIRQGNVGSILNEVNQDTLNKYQKVAVEETRLGIPLLFARDIIHGFKTIFPIPLGQAASWNPDLVEVAARATAVEATAVGIRWTFAPMIDVSRDPRWGRIAESFGEDPHLTALMGVAMVRGFQGDNLSSVNSLAACAKHFAGYGAVEGGRDYNTTMLSEEQLLNNYLVPFNAVADAGCASFMTAFHEINGIPCSGNTWLLKDILRNEWTYQGMVVSDWSSIAEMIPHGYCRDTLEAAEKAINAGVDMDMMGNIYASSLSYLVEAGKVDESMIDEAVRNILRLKIRLGLFEHPYADTTMDPPFYTENHLEIAEELAAQSAVLLKNEGNVLPLKGNVKKIAIIGPLADAPYDQMGTWVFDGEKQYTVTPLEALKNNSQVSINYVETLTHSRDCNTALFGEALAAAQKSDVILYFAGEESILSGEARCRADISLPGAQSALLSELSKTGKPIVMIVMAGRPLDIHKELPFVDALLYVWHPGTMGGTAIADLLFGKRVPSGKLPVTFPKMVGQIPIYYNHKNTGRPSNNPPAMDDIPIEAPQMSLGNTSYYLDAGSEPLFPFGYGLSYTTFEYTDLNLSKKDICKSDTLVVSCSITNTGELEGTEVVQLYLRDLFASVTRPVKELKDFQRLSLKPGETKIVRFEIVPEQLSFWNNGSQLLLEPGEFQVWIGTNSSEGLMGSFELK